MNSKELALLYGINDVVYSQLIDWRIKFLKKWSNLINNKSELNLLEIGTGNYPFGLVFRENCKNINYVGLEPNKTMLERAGLHLDEKFKSSQLIESFWNKEIIEKEKWKNKFDLICSFEVYEHVPANDNFIKNAYNSLKPGGYLIIETPNTQLTPLLSKITGVEPNGAGDYEGNSHVNEKGFHELFLELRENGFEIEDFDNYYLPISLWDDRVLPKEQSTLLYEYIHRAAKEFPFYAYIQVFLAKKK